MRIQSGDYDYLAKRIHDGNYRVIVYGAGMIGQIVVPYIIDKYELFGFVDFYVDKDPRKTGKHISVGNYEYEVKTPKALEEAGEKTIVLLTNSKFYPVV